MSTEPIPARHDPVTATKPPHTPTDHPAPAAGAEPPDAQVTRPAHEEPKPSHSVIARHLTKLRDAAFAILAVIVPPDDREDASREHEPRERPKSPLEIRIERHAAAIDRALTVVARLNPERKSRSGLPEDVRGAIARQEQIIRDVIDAEVHYWSAIVESRPLSGLDEVEEYWVRRLMRLAGMVGCSPDHEEHLAFLRNWSVNVHH
jgi:hypothetical protein